MEQQTRRLVTRIDFDGLDCAMMLKELKLIDEIKFVHSQGCTGCQDRTFKK